MFKNIKNKILSFILMLGIFTSFVNANVPNAAGPYIGVTKIDSSSVTINFVDNSNDEIGFKIIGDINLSIPPHDETLTPNVYTDITGLTCDKVYQIEIIAYNNDGDSTPSDKRDFNMHSTFGVECNVTDVPNAPGSYIGVTSIDKSSVRINFLDNSNNETGFRVIGNDINISIPANDETIHNQVYANITGLTCDKVYSIQALAFNANGNSDLSDLRAFNIHTTFEVECNNTCTAKTDEFVYTTELNGSLKADILFIMDDSGSMSNEQNKVANSISSTFNTVMTNFGIDWKATVIGTERGRNYLNKHINNPSINNINKLASQLHMGTWGGDEVGFLKAYGYLTHGDITIRNNSKLSVVYISDEIAHSTLSDIDGIPDINHSYFVQNNIKVSVIIPTYLQNNSNLAYQLANVTNGIVADINVANYDILMSEIAKSVGGTASKIKLSETPCDVNSIEVLINGVVVNSGWTYIANSNSIIFDSTSTIQNQDTVTVNYRH